MGGTQPMKLLEASPEKSSCHTQYGALEVDARGQNSMTKCSVTVPPVMSGSLSISFKLSVSNPVSTSTGIFLGNMEEAPAATPSIEWHSENSGFGEYVLHKMS